MSKSQFFHAQKITSGFGTRNRTSNELLCVKLKRWPSFDEANSIQKKAFHSVFFDRPAFKCFSSFGQANLPERLITKFHSEKFVFFKLQSRKRLLRKYHLIHKNQIETCGHRQYIEFVIIHHRVSRVHAKFSHPNKPSLIRKLSLIYLH